MEAYVYVLIAAAATVFFAAAFYNGPVVRRYRVESKRLKPGGRIRIVLLSDLHSTRDSRTPKRVAAMSPDFVILAGDMIDDRRPVAAAEEFMRETALIGVPVIYVLGNHEIYIEEKKKLRRAIHNSGVTLLRDDVEKNVANTECSVAGLDYYRGCAPECEVAAMRRLAREMPEGLKLLVMHRPELFPRAAECGFDLILSGHTHGGQVRLFGRGLYSPHQGFLPKYDGGVFKQDGSTLIVSRGLSVFASMPRVFNPREIVEITVEATPGNP